MVKIRFPLTCLFRCCGHVWKANVFCFLYSVGLTGCNVCWHFLNTVMGLVSWLFFLACLESYTRRLDTLKQAHLKSCFLQNIYLQWKKYTRYKRVSDLMITFSTFRTLYTDQASWQPAAQFHLRWSSSGDWGGFAKLWRWCARLSSAMRSPQSPETNNTCHLRFELR